MKGLQILLFANEDSLFKKRGTPPLEKNRQTMNLLAPGRY
jgi:hypothetical protein